MLVLAAIFIAAGIAFSVLWELAVVYLSVSLFRKYSGGQHASTMLACTILSTIVCLAAAFLGRELSTISNNRILLTVLVVLTYGFAFLVVWLRAPVDSPNKPIRTEKKRHRMRRGSFIFLGSTFFAVIPFLIWTDQLSGSRSCCYTLLLAICWQTFTLIPLGRTVIKLTDQLILRLLPIKK